MSSSQEAEQPQSPVSAVLDWGNVSNTAEQSVSSMFTPQHNQSAASFFEDLGNSSSIQQPESFFTSPSTTAASEANTYFDAPVSSSTIPPTQSSSQDELSDLKQQLVGYQQEHENLTNQLHLKENESLQMTQELELIKADLTSKCTELTNQLQLKENKSLQMAQELEHVKADLTSKCSELQSLQSLNQESAQNLQLQMIRNEDLMAQLQTIEKTKEELLQKQSEQEGQIQDLLNRVDHLPSQEIPVSEIQSTSDEKPPTINPDSSNDPSSFFNQNVSSPTFPQNVESVDQSAAASFFSSPQDTSQHFQESDASSYFNSSAQQSEQLQSPVASYFGSETPAVEPLAAEIQPEAPQQQPEAVQQQPAASPEQQLPAVDELSQEQMTANLNWYQTELAGYQQACADWQVWGDEKTREIHELNEHLSYQTEAFRIKAAENEKLTNQLKEKEEEDLKKESGKKNDE